MSCDTSAHDYENAETDCHGHWFCPKCGEDITSGYVVWIRAVELEEKDYLPD